MTRPKTVLTKVGTTTRSLHLTVGTAGGYGTETVFVPEGSPAIQMSKMNGGAQVELAVWSGTKWRLVTTTPDSIASQNVWAVQDIR